MEKDNRSHTKRNRMRAHKKNHYQKISQNTNNNPIEMGLIDVADSSDEVISCRSNQWYRSSASEMDDEELDSEEQIGGDFDILQKMPIAGGSGHFQFSSEKHWDNDDIGSILDKSEASDYFTLNLNILNAGLQTIPFYRRMDYPGIFQRTDIMLMNQEAEVAEIKFQELLKEFEQGIKNKPPSAKRNLSAKSTISEKSSTITTIAIDKDLKIDETSKDAELDELLSLTTSNIATVNVGDSDNSNLKNIENNNEIEIAITDEQNISKNADNGNKEDNQEWLDNILE